TMTETVDAPTVTRIPHWIGGRRVDGGSGHNGPVYNPATGRQTGAVDFATAEEVDAAVQAARDAFPAWRATSLAKRAELFFPVRVALGRRAAAGGGPPGRCFQRRHGRPPSRRRPARAS